MFGGIQMPNNAAPGSSDPSTTINLTPQQIISQARNFMSKGEFYNCIHYTSHLAELAKEITSTLSSSNSANNNNNNNQKKTHPNIIERERVFCLRAEAFLAVKQFAKAEKEARQAIECSQQTSPQAHFALGSALLGQFKISQAVDEFDNAEILMSSPQHWKYVVLPEEDSSVVGGTNTTVSVPRKLRDIGVGELSLLQQHDKNSKNKNSNNGANLSPLLPPPSVTYEWQNLLNTWRNEASLARKLDEAQSSRLLPSTSSLLQGVRMLEQYAKQTSSKFLVLSLRNETDYDLIYQFHTCGSEAATVLAKSSSSAPNNNNQPSVGQSQTQYLMKFPHKIPPSQVGIAVIYTDSWRAKTITLSSTVTFSMERSFKQQQECKKQEDLPASSSSSSPQVRFSFALTSVMSNITANVISINTNTTNNKRGVAPQQSSPPSASTSFLYDKTLFTAFALNQLPPQLYSKTQTSGGLSGTQSDVLKIPAVYLSILQRPAGVKIDPAGATSTSLSTTLIGCVAQYLQPRPLRLASCVSQTWRNVVSSFPPSRFDDFPYGASFPDYTLGRDVRSSPFTVRNPVAIERKNNNNTNNANTEETASSSSSANSHHQQQQPLTQWNFKREDTAMFKTLGVRNARGDPIMFFIGDPPKGSDYQIRLPGGHQGRSLLCRVTSTQGLFKSNRTADVLWVNHNFVGEPNIDIENLSNVKCAKISHKILAEDQLQMITVNMKALMDEQQQILAQQQQSLKSSSSSKSSSDNNMDLPLPGFELIAPRYQSIVGNNSRNNNNKNSTPPITIRDVSSKHMVATFERLENTNGNSGYSYALKFSSQTDGLFCAMLCAEFMVAW